VAPQSTTVERIEQRVIHLDRGAKPTVLAELLRSEPVDRALVFTRTKHGADKVVRGLVKAGIAAEAIHGNKSQNQRERVLAAFRDGKVRTLIATDIAARGIDVTGISHVFNYDLPNIPESYVHRIGRTARAGAEGIAISFCDAEERAYLRDIEKLIRMSIPATSRGVQRVDAPSSQHQRRPDQSRNGRAKDSSRNGHAHRQGQPHKQAGRHHGPRDTNGRDANRHSNGGQTSPKDSVGGVAFLQRKNEPRRDRDFKSMHRTAR